MTTLQHGQRTRRPETITLGQLLTHQFPRRECLVAPWLRQGESAMIWAPTGLGKTMLSLTLALAVAGGGRVLGWDAPKPRRVLLVDGEMHAQDLRDRLAMLAGTVDGIDPEAANENLRIICRQHQDGDVRFPDLAEAEVEGGERPAGQDVLMTAVRESEAELVILDNFTTLAAVEDENSSASMGPVLQFLLRLKQAGRGCILIHHSGKAEASYRGSTAIATTFEVILGLRRLEGRAAGEGAGFEIAWEKYRGRPTEATRDTEVELTGEPPKWTHRAAARAEMQAMLDLLRSGEFQTQTALGGRLGWDRRKVTTLKNRAIEKKLISRQEWDACLSEARGADAGAAETDPEF